MEYLTSQFHDYLNEEGDVNIAGYSFSRDGILQELEKQGYQEAFNEWLQDRQQENLARADTILGLHHNRERFEKLKEIYSRGAIVPFIGAGMSMSSGYPSWTGFLYRVLGETHVSEDDFNRLIQDGLYEEAAQALCDALPPGCFLEQVENAFDASREVIGVVNRLPFMFKSAVVTTNFDKLFELNDDTVKNWEPPVFPD